MSYRTTTIYKLINSPVSMPNIGQLISGLANSGNTNSVSMIFNNTNGIETIYLEISTYDPNEFTLPQKHRSNKSIVYDFLMNNAYVFNEVSKSEFATHNFHATSSQFIKKSLSTTQYVSPSVTEFNLSEIITAVSVTNNSEVRIDIIPMHLNIMEMQNLIRLERAMNRQASNLGISEIQTNSIKDLVSSPCHVYINVVIKTADSRDISLSSKVQAAFINTPTSIGNFPVGLANDYDPLVARDYITQYPAYRLPQEYWSFPEAIKVFCPPYSNTCYTGLELSATSYLPETGNVPIMSNIPYPFLVGNTSQRRRPYYISLSNLIRGGIITGLPRCGKSIFSKRLAIELNSHGIPVLIIEPTKKEFRSLKANISNLKIYTAEKDINPIRINPFIPPRNVTIGKWKNYLLEAFSSLIPMEAPLPQIISMALEKLYTSYGLYNSDTARNITVTITWDSFINAINSVLNNRYSNENRENLRAASAFRLTALLARCPMTFTSNRNTSVESLLNGPVLLELDDMANESKAVIVSLLLANIKAYTEANYDSYQSQIKNAIIIEEAHTLLDSNANDNANNLIVNGIIHNIKTHIVESAGRGIATVIIDQCPSKLGTIVDTVGYHWAFKLRGREAQIINDTINGVNSSNHNVSDALPYLRTGEFVFLDKDSPSPVVIDNLRDNTNYRQIRDDELRALLKK